jgi:hypothetical protein
LPTCLIHIHSGENVLDKVLTVVGADWFNRRRGLLPANAIFINQSFMTWGLREELSSTSLSVPRRFERHSLIAAQSPAEAAGSEDLHLEIRSAELHHANGEAGPPVSV